MTPLRETCTCGHDKATHYREPGKGTGDAFACLASFCPCARYRAAEPKPEVYPRRPNP